MQARKRLGEKKNLVYNSSYITEINEHLYEGRCSPRLPDGKRISKKVYAKTREECEVKLAELIKNMKAEIEMLK